MQENGTELVDKCTAVLFVVESVQRFVAQPTTTFGTRGVAVVSRRRTFVDVGGVKGVHQFVSQNPAQCAVFDSRRVVDVLGTIQATSVSKTGSGSSNAALLSKIGLKRSKNFFLSICIPVSNNCESYSTRGVFSSKRRSSVSQSGKPE
uniref:Uncharacterized protein n=1 Tax=Romanomermis culicivorax TaxID=13658 RepID=A0A915KZI8_ROMCU